MKVLPTVFAAATASISYKDIIWNIREGKPLPPKSSRTDFEKRNFISWEKCPKLPLGNFESFVCDEEYCMSICPPNSQIIQTAANPKGQRKVRCRKDKTWNSGLGTCSSCDPNDFDAEPILSDSWIDMICHTTTRNLKWCILKCKNGEAITNGSGKRRKENVKCLPFKDSNGDKRFVWRVNRDRGNPDGTDVSAFKCPRRPITGPTTPPEHSCMNKDPACTTLGKGAIKYMNNWTCRNCFRIQANYKFNQYKIKNWEDSDYIEIYFKYKIEWINFGYPIDRVEQIGDTGNQWRVYFKPGANFASGMKWDANLRTLQKQWVKDDSIIRGSASCPCSNSVGSTPAPWN